MKQHVSGTKQQSVANAAIATLIVVPLFFVYRLMATKIGIWEPWESDIISWGETLTNAEGASAFLPIARGELVQTPWLNSLLAMWGASIGESPFAMRLPWILLSCSSIAVITYCFSRIFGATRGALIGLIFGLLPAIALSSANASGIIPFAATYSATIAAYCLTRKEDSSPLTWLVVGLCSGLTAWAGLLPGFSAVIFTVLGLQLAKLSSNEPLAKLRLVGSLILFVTAIVVFSLGLPNISSLEAEVSNSLARGLAIYLLVPLAGCVLLLRPRAGLERMPVVCRALGFGVVLVFWAIPLISLGGHLSLIEILQYLIHPEPLVATNHSSTPFTDFIRMAGFGLFPLTALLFYAMDYTVRTTNDSFSSTDFSSSAAHNSRLMLVSSVAVTFALFVVVARSSGVILFAMPLGIAALTVLSFTDNAYRAWLATHPIIRRVHALTASMVMLVLSKDLRGTFDKEGGRPGPRVMVELLVGDGEKRVPELYTFEHITWFILAWMLCLLIGWLLLPDIYNWWCKRKEQPTTNDKTEAMVQYSGLVWLALAGAFCVSLAILHIPALSPDFSSAGLQNTLKTLETESSTLVVQKSHTPWTLRHRETKTFRSPNELRQYFCKAEGRVFAALPTDDIPSYYQSIRTSDRSQRNDCVAGFHVLYGASSQFALVSNELHKDHGESEQGIVARSIVTEKEIPDSATRFDPPYVLDDKLKLIAAEITPSELVSGDFNINTYWRIKERVRRDFQMFIHVDGPGSRINGDHELVGGNFPITRWTPGDIVVDKYTMTASLLGDAKGTYHVLIGMFDDDTRMEVKPSVKGNRIEVGTLDINWPFGFEGF